MEHVRVLALCALAFAGCTDAHQNDDGGADPQPSDAEPPVPVDAATPDPTPDAGTGDAGEDPGMPPAFECPGGTVGPGMNTLTVDGMARTFVADFPTDTTGPMGLLFSWHGYGDTGANFRAAVGLDPDAIPELPMVIITPDDTGLGPPTGLDWDIRPDDNRDLAFFEAMVGCMTEQHSIDPTAIYSFGFSAGSVMTALLHSTYPETLSAVVAVSGAWFNDEAEADLVNIFTIDWNWPPLDAADGGAVLLTHGGESDKTVLNVLDLEASAQAAIPFLREHGRVVIDCAHDNGHTLHPELTPEMIMGFVSAHRAGAASPYLTTDLEGFPASCTLLRPE